MLSTIFAAGGASSGNRITNPAFGGGALSGIGRGSDFFAKLIPNLITLGLVASFVIFFFYLLYGGIRWIMAGGDKSNLESARSHVTNAVVGLFIILSMWALTMLIENVFSINILRINISSFILQ
jgi:hypothetical protein